MSRVVILAVVIAALPPACAKLVGKKAPAPAEDPVATNDPPPPPPPSGTTPPIWQQNPNITPTSSASSLPFVDPASADLTKAQAAFDAKDFKKAKTILEKRVKGGKCVADEVTLLTKTCQQLKDKTCTADAKKACPNTSNDPVKTGF